MTGLPRYDPQHSYLWNYHHAPDPVDVDVPDVPGDWQFCGRRVASPLGMPAGPLLNGRWCLYYASLGFDVLTYKTVRSREYPCYPPPNLQPVECEKLGGSGSDVPVSAAEAMTGSWAVSFGMPSQPPHVWRADVERTRDMLPKDKLLVVSVVGTTQPGWTIDDLASDYAQCACWAAESGADAVELNFSCPNVATADGQLYQHALHAARVAAQVRESLPDLPLLLKIGHVRNPDSAAALVESVAGAANALSMVNCIAERVLDRQRQPMFAGEMRGIAGLAIREASLAQLGLFQQVIRRAGSSIDLVGVGGVFTAQHVLAYLTGGATAVQLATAAMLDPAVALEIRRELQCVHSATD